MRVKANARTVDCPTCGASKGSACFGDQGYHIKRQDFARRLYEMERAQRPGAVADRIAREARARAGRVTRRFVCPDCGGPHPRGGCDQAA